MGIIAINYISKTFAMTNLRSLADEASGAGNIFNACIRSLTYSLLNTVGITSYLKIGPE
jgi:hypothetical protein